MQLNFQINNNDFKNKQEGHSQRFEIRNSILKIIKEIRLLMT
jgi:hypothetical protein